MSTKRICLLLTALMLFTLTACGKGTEQPSNTDQPTNQVQTADAQETQDTQDTQDDQDDRSGSQTAEAAPSVQPGKLTGELSLIQLDDRDSSVLRGLRIVGNSIGSQEDINGKESSLTDVRCIFCLNEWVEFYPDADAESQLRVWILKHRDDQEYYNTCQFSEQMPDFANCCDLRYPADAENPDDWYWGSFYLNGEDCEPGYYDFVFTCEGKAIAVLQTRFCQEGELSEKSGEELESLMHE